MARPMPRLPPPIRTRLPVKSMPLSVPRSLPGSHASYDGEVAVELHLRLGPECLRLLRGIFTQARHHLLGEERHAVDRFLVAKIAGLAEHQQMAEAAGAIAERRDLVVELVGRAGEHDPALGHILPRWIGRKTKVDSAGDALLERHRV